MDIVVPADGISRAALGLVGAGADTATALGGLIFGLFVGSLRLQLGGDILHGLSGAALRLLGAATDMLELSLR